MKKYLLIIALTLCIFQMIVLAIDIDIGSGAIDRADYDQFYTNVDCGNPANADGTIDTIEIWAHSNLTGCEIGIFYVVSGNTLSTRSNVTIGNVTSGSKQTFTQDFEGNPISLEVHEGDYLGIYQASGAISYSEEGLTSAWYKSGDQIPANNVTFSITTTCDFSIYGTGTTVVGWPHKWNTQAISKWNTKEIMKWNDLE